MKPLQLAYIGLAVLVAAAMVYVHSAAAFTFPPPWGDEAYFVWQARAFERWTSFIAPELDATRPLFLLPFTYGATLGVVFKILGYSFALARDVSLVFTLTGFALLAVLVRRQTAALGALALVGAAMLNANFVVMANNARMEAYFFAAVCCALLLMHRGQHWRAVAVLAITPMIHPNGVFFLGPAVAYGLWTGDLRRQRPDRAAWIILGMAAVAWLANGVYALAYWDGFMHETALRFGETFEKHGGWSQFQGFHAVGFVLIVGTLVAAKLRQPTVAPLPLFALGAWLCARIRIEQWYDVFADFAYLLLALAVIELVAETVVRAAPQWQRFRASIAVVVTLGWAGLYYMQGRIEGPVGYLSELQRAGMRLAPPGAYFRAEDRQAIQQQLDALAPGCPVSVEVYPWGDALLFADLGDGRVRFQVPYFDPMFQPQERWAWGYEPTPGAVPDLYIIRLSRYQPAWLKDRDQRVLARALSHAGVDRPTTFHTRDSTEVWYAIQPATAARRC